MNQKLLLKDGLRVLLGFVLGVAVTLLVSQLMGEGSLLKGTLSISPNLAPAMVKTTDSNLSNVIQRLPSGERAESSSDDKPGLP